MKKKIYVSMIAWGAFAVAACGQGGDGTTEQAESESTAASQTSSTAGTNVGGPSAQPSGQVHSGNGDITEISSNSVTISHGPVESIGWPAMTMTFEARSPEMLQGLNVGDPVNFEFQQAGDTYVLTSITRAQQ